jgi:pimeloyl-ACP methyl ester carboxylesterase
MKARVFFLVLCCAISCTSFAYAYPVNFGPGFKTRAIDVDGATVSVTVGGRGPVVVLLHGYAEDSRMWKPLAPKLAPRFTIIAPDLPGFGNSSIPSSGLNLITAAKRVRDAVHALGYSKAIVVGHDIGLMVAYAYATSYPQEVTKLALMDAFLPGVPGWEPIYDNPNLWHFRFHGPTPLKLVAGRERTYFDYYWNDFAADKNRSIPESDRKQYVQAYSRPGRMAAGWAYFASFPETALRFSKIWPRKLSMPVFSIGGAKANGAALGKQAKLIASNATVVVLQNAGHWLMEEQPAQTMSALTQFLERR